MSIRQKLSNDALCALNKKKKKILIGEPVQSGRLSDSHVCVPEEFVSVNGSALPLLISLNVVATASTVIGFSD